MSWKNPYIQNSVLEKALQMKRSGKSFPIKVWSRSSTILPLFVGLRFSVYNGKDFFPLLATEEMIGLKFGEFVPTRARYKFKSKKKKK
jgi:small subunit ribosomal protein S19